MNTEDINDPVFRNAVDAIDSGNLDQLKNIVSDHPYLLNERLVNNEQGYFKDPYLLYFIADNPIRNHRVADNVVDVTRWLVNEIKIHAEESWQNQIDYTLGLVVTGSSPRESNVQFELTDFLIDTGATPGAALGAIAHGNKEIAAHLIKRGALLTLPIAVGLQMPQKEITQLRDNATDIESIVAITVAAFYGDAEMISFLIGKNFPVNGYPDDSYGFHSHGTPLHQAVYSGSLPTVKLLVEAGASLTAKDKIFGVTPLGWAEYSVSEESDAGKRNAYEEIAGYLSGKRMKQ